MKRYVIVTPVRDEAKYVAATIESVSAQTIRPVEWIIVNDGSTDRTGDIIDRYSAEFSWIRVVHRSNRGFRKAGGGVDATRFFPLTVRTAWDGKQGKGGARPRPTNG